MPVLLTAVPCCAAVVRGPPTCQLCSAGPIVQPQPGSGACSTTCSTAATAARPVVMTVTLAAVCLEQPTPATAAVPAVPWLMCAAGMQATGPTTVAPAVAAAGCLACVVAAGAVTA